MVPLNNKLEYIAVDFQIADFSRQKLSLRQDKK